MEFLARISGLDWFEYLVHSGLPIPLFLVNFLFVLFVWAACVISCYAEAWIPTRWVMADQFEHFCWFVCKRIQFLLENSEVGGF